MALIQVDDTNFQKISNFGAVPADQIKDTDLITGLHNGGNANFRIYDIVSKVMAGLDIDPGQDPGYDPGGELGEQVTYSVIIDHSKSDSSRMVTYADDATGQTPGWANWRLKPIFKKLKNCVLQNGAVQYYLSFDNVGLKEDGTSADITTLGNDVMLELPERLGYRFIWLDNDRLKVSITNRPNATGFSYNAFSYSSSNDCDKIYIGRYLLTVNGNRGYSSGRVANANDGLTYSDSKNRCIARGSGYDMMQYYAYTLMQVLLVIMDRSLDFRGVYGVSEDNHVGYGNNRPFSGTYGNPSVVLGVENLFCSWVYVDGLRSDSNGDAVFSLPSGGTTTRAVAGVGYFAKPYGDNVSGFFPRDNHGSSSTYYKASYLWKTANGFYEVGVPVDGLGSPFNIGSLDASTGGFGRLMYFHRDI